MRKYCTNFRCLFRKTCWKAQAPLEGEKFIEFNPQMDDIRCPEYDTMLTKHDLTDHTQAYLDYKYKKYGIKK